ncbi:hypothetical protein STENM223S_06193 [Streptomyces tendae]
MSSPRPYSRINTLAGSRGIVEDYAGPAPTGARVYVEPDHSGHTWRDFEGYRKEYDHWLWQKVGDDAANNGGHGGMDYVLQWRTVQLMRAGLVPDIDVYDSAAWCSPVPLSVTSLARGGRPVEIPDFTRGAWGAQAGPRFGAHRHAACWLSATRRPPRRPGGVTRRGVTRMYGRHPPTAPWRRIARIRSAALPGQRLLGTHDDDRLLVRVQGGEQRAHVLLAQRHARVGRPVVVHVDPDPAALVLAHGAGLVQRGGAGHPVVVDGHHVVEGPLQGLAQVSGARHGELRVLVVGQGGCPGRAAGPPRH